MTTPANWQPGDDVVVHASVPTEEARKLFPNLVEHKVTILQFLDESRILTRICLLVLSQDNVTARVKVD